MGSLTKTERSIIIGSLLGDGYLRVMKGRSNAFLEINHTYAQKEYVDWKHYMLRSICKSYPVKRNGNGTRIAYRFNTRQHTELTELWRLFYPQGKKQIPKNIQLDPIVLAIWYMDDGSKCRERDVYLNTQQFSIEDQQICVNMLSNLNIESSLNRDKQYWRIRIKNSSLPTFFAIIAPYVVPTMQYKFSYNPVETCSNRNGVVLVENG